MLGYCIVFLLLKFFADDRGQSPATTNLYLAGWFFLLIMSGLLVVKNAIQFTVTNNPRRLYLLFLHLTAIVVWVIVGIVSVD